MKKGPLLAVILLVVRLLGEGGSFQEPRSGEAGCHYDSTVRAIRKWQEPSQGSAENAFFYIPLVLILLFTAALEYLGLQRRKPGVELKRLRTR